MFPLVLTMIIWVGNAFSTPYTIEDKTLVSFNGTSGWGDIIGDFVFDVYGINVSWTGSQLILDMYTNFDSDGDYKTPWGPDPNHHHAYLADLLLDANRDGTFDYGVVMKRHADWLYTPQKPSDWGSSGSASLEVGLYSVTGLYRPSDFWGSGYIYGSYYDKSNNPGGPHSAATSYTTIKTGASGPAYADVRVTDLSVSGPPNYRWQVKINRADLGSYDGKEIDIFWGGANCANDAIYGQVPPVPEPGTLVLLVSGLIGLAGYGKFRLSRKEK